MAEYDFEKLVGVVRFADHKLGFKRSKVFSSIIQENIINKLELLEESQHHLQFRYISSLTYEIFLELQHNRGPPRQDEPPDSIVVTCTCPFANERQTQICKHGVAALLWRLPPSEQRKLTAASGTTSTAAAIAAVMEDQVQASAPSARTHPSSACIVPKKKRFLPKSIINPQNATNRNNGEVAAMLPTKKAKIAPEKKKPSLKVQLQKQHLPAAVVNRPSTSVPAHPIKLQGPRRWMNEAEMQAIADSTLLEQCKEALETIEPIFISQQKQLDVQRRPPQQQREQGGRKTSEEEEFHAPAAPPPYSTQLDLPSLDTPAGDPTPLPIATNLPPPPAAEDAGTAPPAPVPVQNSDDFNFFSHFLTMK